MEKDLSSWTKLQLQALSSLSNLCKIFKYNISNSKYGTRQKYYYIQTTK